MTVTKNIKLVIATTEAPATLTKLQQEEPILKSRMEWTGEFAPLHLSYDDFVKQVIHKLWFAQEIQDKRPSFVAKLDEKITQGESWQLGMLIAHAANHVGWLEFENQECDVIWASGILTNDDDLKIKRIESLALKLERSANLFEAVLKSGRGLTLCLPSENQQDQDCITLLNTLQTQGACIIYADNGLNLLTALGLNPPKKLSANVKLNWIFPLILIGGLIAGGLGYWGYQQFSKPTEPATIIEPEPVISEIESPLNYRLIERLAYTNNQCDRMPLRNGKTLPLIADQALSVENHRDLCGFEFIIEYEGKMAITLTTNTNLLPATIDLSPAETKSFMLEPPQDKIIENKWNIFIKGKIDGDDSQQQFEDHLKIQFTPNTKSKFR